MRYIVPMAPVGTSARTFGDKLRAEFDRRGMGARTLARELSSRHGGAVEDRRRAIIRWLQGATPLDRNRELVEDVLGLSRGELRGDDDDEEADPVAEAAREAYMTLVDALTAQVAAAIDKKKKGAA
jgi:hypothetical protein